MFGSLLAKLFPMLGDVLDRVIPDPEARQAAKIEMLKLAQAGEFKEIDAMLEGERIAAEDRASARTLQQVTKDPIPRWLAVGFVIGFFAILIALFTVNVPNESTSVLQVLLGALAGGVIQILNFYFGSSSGSKGKDDVMAGMAMKLTGTGDASSAASTTTVTTRTPAMKPPVPPEALRPLPPRPIDKDSS